MPAYCTTADVLPLLGDMELSSGFNVQAYVDRAAVEIDLALGRKYEVPVTSTDYFTIQLLATVNADFAASQILMSQASGGEDTSVNAYARYLWNRAQERLIPYLEGMTFPGSTIRNPDATDGPAAIYQQDIESPFEVYYRFVQGGDVLW